MTKRGSGASPGPALKVAGLHSYYGSSHVLQGIDMEVLDGNLLALLGRNGAGKTTLVHTIMGMVRPSQGSIEIFGAHVAGKPAHEIVRAGVALVPQGRRIFAELTVEENLRLASARKYQSQWQIDDVYTLLPRLKERRHHSGNQISGGEQQMLAIGRALLLNPRLLLLDEPSEGLAPIVVQAVEEVLDSLRQVGIAAVLVEQSLNFALRIADRVAIMESGRITWSGTPEEARASSGLVRRALGVG